MKKIAIYPGSFDPITNGHLDILKRACKLFDEVILAIGENVHKKATFTIDERLTMVKEAVKGITNVRVDTFSELSVAYAKKHKASVIIRGLRVVNDFEKEFQMALMNEQLDQEIEMVFLMARHNQTFISSSLIKELATYRHDIRALVPEIVWQFLVKKYSI